MKVVDITTWPAFASIHFETPKGCWIMFDTDTNTTMSKITFENGIVTLKGISKSIFIFSADWEKLTGRHINGAGRFLYRGRNYL